MILARYALLYLLPLAALISGCGDDDGAAVPAPDTTLARYYPLELDRPAYYAVDSVVLFRTVGGVRYDSSRSEARETLVGTFVGADGQTYYRGERWVRSTTDDPFRFKQTFTVTFDGRTVVRSEDNLSFTKLVLPLREGNRWDGNAAFDATRPVPVGGEFLDVYQGWEYAYTDLDTTYTLANGTAVGEVVTVRQAEVENLIDLRRAYERYAPGYGQVERYLDARYTQYEVCCNRDTEQGQALSWDEKAEKGYIIHERLLRRD